MKNPILRNASELNHVKRKGAGVLFFLIGIAFFLSDVSTSAEHYRIYMLGGQSNSTGRGDASQLTAPLDAPQPDVRLYCHRTLSVTNAIWLTEDEWIDLAPGAGHGMTAPIYPKEFGSELSFGRTIADTDPSTRMAIIKYTHGGSNLHSQWSASGSMYATFVATVEAALVSLRDAGHTYELGGMLWHQGEADASLASAANAYEANLTSLINRIRQDIFEGRRLPFIVGGLSNSQNSSVETPGSNWNLVRQAQEAVARNMIQVGFVNTDGYSTRIGEAIHYNHDGQIALGEDFASEILRLEALDADRDGLLLSEEALLGTDPNDADSDDDEQNDGLEVRAGTDPLSASSLFKVLDIAVIGEQASLQWPSKEGNFYRIERSSNLIDWSVAVASYSASTGSITYWSGLAEDPGDGILARYDAQVGIEGNFNTNTFDSVDSDIPTLASRLAQGGSLGGGGVGVFVLDHTLFDSSDSGSPGFNVASVASANQATALAAGDYFSFTLEASGKEVSYESLSFFANQAGSTCKVDVSYTVSGIETFILQGFTPVGSNAPVVKELVDFEDFTSTEDVTWTFYLYGAPSTNHGTRFDDITLKGQSTKEPVAANFFRLYLLSQ